MPASRAIHQIGKCKSVESRHIIRDLTANELIFAVVGPIGSGTSSIASKLAECIRLTIDDAEVVVVKASDLIRRWASEHARAIEASLPSEVTRALQDAGNAMRADDPASIAVRFISEVKAKRAASEACTPSGLADASASKTFRAFILD